MATYGVFLSYGSTDERAVETLARRLRRDGFKTFLQKWHLIAGRPFQEGLEEALEKSRTCVVFVGQELGPWQKEEIRTALVKRARNSDFRVIPVLLPGALRPDSTKLPRFLQQTTWVDFREGLDDKDAYYRLVCGLRGVAPRTEIALESEKRRLWTSDTSEKGLESLICEALTGTRYTPKRTNDQLAEPRTPYGGAGYVYGHPEDYDRDHAVDIAKLLEFLQATQPQTVEQLGVAHEGPDRLKFLNRLQGEIAKRGITDVLRNGIRRGPASVDLFYGTPSPGNTKAEKLFAANLFSVTRQLRYSRDETQLALDLALFINGLPVATFELKNRLTKQTVDDAVQQYKSDRKPNELLFQFGRCLAHFAVDDQEVRFCTHLEGKASWFLPFNKGYNDGAGNPPNPHGIKTDYLWHETLTRQGLTDVLENYAQVVEDPDPRRSRKKKEKKQIFPRYHQLDVVHFLLEKASSEGAGRRYLIQHSAGSGKSNSIAWLTHQLVGLERQSENIFDTVIVVTDRRVLDRQIRDTIRQFAQVGATIGHAEHSGDLRRFIQSGKRIITTTVQKFPFILDDIGSEHRSRSFAILIDEAHSSQGGRTAAKMNIALSAAGAEEEDETIEDKVNRIMEARKMLPNASYFAFTATPKNKTLEIFGEPYPEGEKVKHKPHHTYSMKQAIDEGFILDVLRNYTPVASYYRLAKTIEDDPEFDTKKARKKLRRYVEGHEHAIREKAEIMVDHFHQQVLARNKVGGQARAMVVTGVVDRAIAYFHAFRDYLPERRSPYKPIVAFSGEREYGGKKVTESGLNGFPSHKIVERIQEDPYRFLICADKFQTGYDEPLLHTMYVDKPLSGIRAVQTLSRLNRAHPKKHDTFVLDFMNDAETIRAAFADYYRTTILSAETDPDKLHDLKSDLDGYQVYDDAAVDQVVERYLSGADRDLLDPVLDLSVKAYGETLDEDAQVDFKGKAKAFVRTYGFLASVLPYGLASWDKLSIFLNLLIPKLPAPREDDLSRGILETIDMDSYRVEMRAAMDVALADEDAEIEPVPASGGGRMQESELDRLSNILRAFNEQFGHLDWKDPDKVSRVIAEEIPSKVAADTAYQNAIRHSDKQNARIEHDNALQRVLVELLTDHTELFKNFSDNASFRRWLSDMVFSETYHPAGSAYRPQGRFSDLKSRLRASEDPLDALSLTLLGTLERHDRLTFADALALAGERGLSDTDAFIAIERLARPSTAGLRRYYIDRSAEEPRLLTPSEVRDQLIAERPESEREEWMLGVEVAWAETEKKALARVGAS